MKYCGLTILLSTLILSCKQLHEIEKLPNGSYFISSKSLTTLDPQFRGGRWQKVLVKEIDSSFQFRLSKNSEPIIISKSSDSINNISLHKRSFDLDIFTIPFKIRPSINGFPPQLNPNFSAALYLGSRHDFISFNNVQNDDFTIHSQGFGYGVFIGLGSVTMNPFVTEGGINYEYDGIVLNSGLAGIYTAKKFNVGLSLGTDLLLDKNKKTWLYHKKPWLGVLFGINLN